MEKVIPHIPKEKIRSELTQERFLRKTNKGNNEIYVINYHNSPYVMQEIGRLREISFREAGGGTGKEVDIDQYDTMDDPYEQLIVWDPEAEEILGGYRYIRCNHLHKDPSGRLMVATSKLFDFSEKFIKEYLPYTLELGRSFVQPRYQSSRAGAKSLFALDNLWDGLGALTVDEDIRYFFGKVTMYPDYPTVARDLILHFLYKHFPDGEGLVTPKYPLETQAGSPDLDEVFTGADFKENYQILNKRVRNLGVNIPPLVNAYMNLSPTMKTFGTAVNPVFGDVEETGILITISDIFSCKKKRYFESYIDEINQRPPILH